MPRKKQADFNEKQEEEFEWDKSRIIGFFVVVGILIVGGLLFKHFFLDSQSGPAGANSQSVQGASSQQNTSNTSQLPSFHDIQQGAQQQIASLQKQASQISVQQIASTSPQVQQIIQQLQQLPQLPGDVAKQTCEQLCGKL